MAVLPISSSTIRPFESSCGRTKHVADRARLTLPGQLATRRAAVVSGYHTVRLAKRDGGVALRYGLARRPICEALDPLPGEHAWPKTPLGATPRRPD